MAGRLICLIGIDGAGKKTQARGLVEELRAAGVPVEYRYDRTLPHVTQFLVGLARPLLLPGVDPTVDFADYTARKRARLRRHRRAPLTAEHRDRVPAVGLRSGCHPAPARP